MSYILSEKEALLPQAVAKLLHRPNIKGQCLGYVRAALGDIGLRLPSAEMLIQQTGHSTALACYHALAKDPAKYGWQEVHSPSSHPVLLQFFNRCGYENGGNLEAGHIALKQGTTLYASMDYPDTEYFKTRLLGSFIPL